MRTLFDQGTDMTHGCSGVVNSRTQTLRDSPEKGGTLKPSFVTLEINVNALQRLIDRHALMVDEIHCVDQRSKSVVRQALLMGLLEPNGVDKTDLS